LVDLHDLWALCRGRDDRPALVRGLVLTAAFAARHGYSVIPTASCWRLAWQTSRWLAAWVPGVLQWIATAVGDGAGAESKRVGLLAALLLVPFLLFLTPLLQTLPHVALAAIIIVSSAA